MASAILYYLYLVVTNMSKKTGNEQKQGNGTATDAKVDIRRNAKGGVLVTREDVKQVRYLSQLISS